MAFDSDKEPISSLAYEIFGDYWSLFVITEDGDIRRVSIPSHLWPHTIFLMCPGTDIEPEFFDAGAKRCAADYLCSYADAMGGMIDRFFDDEAFDLKFVAAMRNKEWWAKRQKGFLDEQLRREKLWRERYDIWDRTLPPALD